MSLKDLKKKQKTFERTDHLGGFTVHDSGVYPVEIVSNYLDVSQNGAHFWRAELNIAGSTQAYTFYFTNSKGENYWSNANGSNYLPGFVVVDDLCEILTSNPLYELDTVEKVVGVYNPETKKEEPQKREVLVELNGQTFMAAIQKVERNKSEKSGDEYVLTAETRFENEFVKVANKDGFTLVELIDEAEEPTFLVKWAEKNAGVTRNAVKPVTGNTSTSSGEKRKRRRLGQSE